MSRCLQSSTGSKGSPFIPELREPSGQAYCGAKRNQSDRNAIGYGLRFLILGHSDGLASSYDTHPTSPELSQGYEVLVGSVNAA